LKPAATEVFPGTCSRDFIVSIVSHKPRVAAHQQDAAAPRQKPKRGFDGGCGLRQLGGLSDTRNYQSGMDLGQNLS